MQSEIQKEKEWKKGNPEQNIQDQEAMSNS